MVPARNQSLTESNGSDVMKPTSSIISVPSTTPSTSGTKRYETPSPIVATASATNIEMDTRRINLADRYSQNRSGVEMTALSVRSCFSKNTVPATKKNPMMEVSPMSM